MADDLLPLLDATPDGLRLSAWWESRGISRATAQRMLHASGITPGRARVPGARSPVAFLSAEQLAQLDAMAARMAGGATVAEAAGAALSRPEPARAPARASQPEPAQGGDQASLSQLEALALRARACQALLSTGQPVTTAEAAALLLAHPGGDRVVAGGLVAERIGRNRWRIVSA